MTPERIAFLRTMYAPGTVTVFPSQLACDDMNSVLDALAVAQEAQYAAVESERAAHARMLRAEQCAEQAEQRAAVLREAVTTAAVTLNREQPEPGVGSNYWLCALCGNWWDEDAPTKHAPSCILAASGGAAPAERADPHLPPFDSFPVEIEITEFSDGTPAERAAHHEYEGACRNVQHAATGACACNALINGRLCRLSRTNPIHERQQPPAACQEGRA